MVNKIRKGLLLSILTTSIIGPASSLVNFEIDRDLQKMSDPAISLTEKIKHLNNSQLSQVVDFDESVKTQTHNALAHNLNELSNAIQKLEQTIDGYSTNQNKLEQKIDGYSTILEQLVNDLYALKNNPTIENLLKKHQGALAQVNSGSFESRFNLRNNDEQEEARARYHINNETIQNSEAIFGKNLGESNNDSFNSLINIPPPPPLLNEKIPGPPSAPPPPPLPGAGAKESLPNKGKRSLADMILDKQKNLSNRIEAEGGETASTSQEKPRSFLDDLKDLHKNSNASKNTAAKKEQENIAKKAVLLMRNGVTLNSPSGDIKEALGKIGPNDLNTVTADESAVISGDLNLLNRWRKIILSDQAQGNGPKNKLNSRAIEKQAENVNNNEKSRDNLMASLSAENPLARLRSVRENPRPLKAQPGDNSEEKPLSRFKMKANAPVTLFTIHNSLEENKIKLKTSLDKKNNLTSKAEDAAEKAAILRTIENLNATIRYQENKLTTETKQRLSVLLEMGFNKDNVSDENIRSITAEQLKNARIDAISDDMASEWKDKIIQAFKPN